MIFRLDFFSKISRLAARLLTKIECVSPELHKEVKWTKDIISNSESKKVRFIQTYLKRMHARFENRSGA